MKKILGIVLCMVLLLVGSVSARGSLPTHEKVWNETVVAATDAETPQMSHDEMIAKLERASEWAMQKACAETAERRADVMDTSGIMLAVAELRANAVSREQVARLSSTKNGCGAVHRCRNCNNRWRSDYLVSIRKMREG